MTHESHPPGVALKVMEREIEYRREKSVYQRLLEEQVILIRGCNVPLLLEYDDELQILVMSLVTRPFVLDFGGAYLDYPPDFSDEVLAEWEREKREQYGDRWPEVQAILRELEKFDIYMVDVNPGNISFAAE